MRNVIDASRKVGPITNSFTVWRHPGTKYGAWQIVFAGEEQPARDAFNKHQQELRQGAVRLYEPFGSPSDEGTDRLLRSSSAPRLRTRW